MAFEAAIRQAETMWVGTWQNEKGSVMRIRSVEAFALPPNPQPHLRIDGTYQSRVGHVGEGASHPLGGFVIGDIIAFSVSYHGTDEHGGEVRSVTSWSGQQMPSARQDPAAARGTESLKTLWHLTRDFGEGKYEELNGWVLALSGSDTFERLSEDPDHAVA
jgi:hypothetical protein